ncbi:MAG TPA: hypothetical protein VFG35_17100 [Actinoplanes sp.]|nr:hypothetical protein [Actinoplanes sp.]
MHRASRPAMAAACIAALTACGNSTPTAEPSRLAEPSGLAEPSRSAAPSRSPSAVPSASSPKLVDANVSELKNFAIDLGVPVVIVLTLDSGGEYHLRSHPDGSADFTGTAVTESTRMRIDPAKVRKRTAANKNHVAIAASPKVAAAGPASCLTDKREAVLRMEPCRPGDATQSWQLTPAGDSGLFELTGPHTAIRSERGPVIKEGGWTAFQTIAVTP